jgi:hypothetical protein
MFVGTRYLEMEVATLEHLCAARTLMHDMCNSGRNDESTSTTDVNTLQTVLFNGQFAGVIFVSASSQVCVRCAVF